MDRPASRTPAVPDAGLVRAAQNGERRAMEELFKRHVRMAYGLAYRLLGQRQDVDDVVQESFTQALGSLSQLQDPNLFGTWLGRIVVHTVNRLRRRDKLHRLLGFRPATSLDLDGLIAPTAPPEVRIELEQLYRQLARLPEKWRTVFIMRRIEERKLEDIAVLVGASLASVKRWFTKAVSAIDEAPPKGGA